MTSRRQFLAAAAALAALPGPGDATGDSKHDSDRTHSPRSVGGERAPLEGLYSSVYAEGTFDESVELDATAGEMWTGEQWVPVVDLSIEFWMGDVAITLDEQAGRALAEELLEAFDEPERD